MIGRLEEIRCKATCLLVYLEFSVVVRSDPLGFGQVLPAFLSNTILQVTFPNSILMES